MNESKDLAMIVMSCDAYTNVGYLFFKLQEHFMGWFRENRYFVNESKDVDFGDVNVIHVGTGVNWSEKLQRALKYIDKKYVLFMLEDYLIGKTVLESEINEAIILMKNNRLRYYKITAIPKSRKKSEIAPYLSCIPSNLRYGINLQAAIFEKEFLQEITSGDDRSAWKVETDLLNLVTHTYEYDLPGCVIDNRNIIDVHNGILKGKWFPKTIKYFHNLGFEIDLNGREILSKKEVLKQNVERSISHILPVSIVRKVKFVLKKMGMKFVSEN